MDIVKFNFITKSYLNKKKLITAVDNISFTIKEGEIIGLIGPNGAGKSTIVKLLCGILSPSSGNIEVLNLIPCKNRKHLSKEIGVMFGNRSSLWYNIPAIESVYLMKDIYNIESNVFNERLHLYSNILDIQDILQKPVRLMSLGQRIRIELLVTILHNPKLLILDEPTLGLDIVSKNQLRDMFSQLAKESKTTIILTTHDISDVEKICDRVILINNGQKLIDSTQNEFKTIINTHDVVIIDIENIDLDDLCNSIYFREKTPQWYKFFIPKQSTEHFLNSILINSNYNIKFKIEKPSLEDILYEYYS